MIRSVTEFWEKSRDALEEATNAFSGQCESLLSEISDKIDAVEEIATAASAKISKDVQVIVQEYSDFVQEEYPDFVEQIEKLSESIQEKVEDIEKNWQQTKTHVEEALSAAITDLSCLPQRIEKAMEVKVAEEEKQTNANLLSEINQEEPQKIPALCAKNQQNNSIIIAQPNFTLQQHVVNRLFEIAEFRNDSKKGLRLSFTLENEELSIDEALKRLIGNRVTYHQTEQIVKKTKAYTFLENLDTAVKAKSTELPQPNKYLMDNHPISADLINSYNAFIETFSDTAVVRQSPDIISNPSHNQGKDSENLLNASSSPSLSEEKGSSSAHSLGYIELFFSLFFSPKEANFSSDLPSQPLQDSQKKEESGSSYGFFFNFLTVFIDNYKSNAGKADRQDSSSIHSGGYADWFFSFFSSSKKANSPSTSSVGAKEASVNFF